MPRLIYITLIAADAYAITRYQHAATDFFSPPMLIRQCRR